MGRGRGVSSPHPVFFYAARNDRRGMGRHHRLIVGTLNVRGCNTDVKRCMIVNMFRERKMDVLVLSETTGERHW